MSADLFAPLAMFAALMGWLWLMMPTPVQRYRPRAARRNRKGGRK